MSILYEALHDLLRFLAFTAWGCGVVIWLLAARQAFVRAGAMPEWRGLLTLRRPLASELSQDFHVSNRRFIRLMLAFVPVVGVGALLFWLDTLFFPAFNN